MSADLRGVNEAILVEVERDEVVLMLLYSVIVLSSATASLGSIGKQWRNVSEICIFGMRKSTYAATHISAARVMQTRVIFAI